MEKNQQKPGYTKIQELKDAAHIVWHNGGFPIIVGLASAALSTIAAPHREILLHIVVGMIGGALMALVKVYKRLDEQSASATLSDSKHIEMLTKMETSIERLEPPPRPQYTKEDGMYSAMLRTLKSLNPPEEILVTSFQSGNPESGEASHAMKAYHDGLKQYLNNNPTAAVRRILAVHTKDKIHWLHKQVEEYSKIPSANGRGASVRVYECENNFDEALGIVELPAIFHIFKNTVFLAHPKTASPHHYDDVECIVFEDERFANFWRRYFGYLWETCRDREVLKDSKKCAVPYNKVMSDQVKSYIMHCITKHGHTKTSTEQEKNQSFIRVCGDIDIMLDTVGYEFFRPTYVPDVRPHPYHREVLAHNDDYEVMIAFWNNGQSCLPHDHGGSSGRVRILNGSGLVTNYDVTVPTNGVSRIAKIDGPKLVVKGTPSPVDREIVHSMQAQNDGLVTLHIYSKRIPFMHVYDLEKKKAIRVSSQCGAWWPNAPHEFSDPRFQFNLDIAENI